MLTISAIHGLLAMTMLCGMAAEASDYPDNVGKTKEYIGRRKSSPGKKVSILGPLGPVGSLGPGRREIQI